MARAPRDASPLVPLFGEGFLEHHAGRIVSDPATAIVELVANGWDAGADQVLVEWPTTDAPTLSVEDNGCGMSHEQLQQRWFTINYDRTREQGSAVEFPPHVPARPRQAWGRNGLGRHAMFCFADEYVVDTSNGTERTVATVTRSAGRAVSPYTLHVTSRKKTSGFGTRISASSSPQLLFASDVRDILGARFAIDPQFAVSVNRVRVTLTDIEAKTEPRFVHVPGVGDLRVRRIDLEAGARSSRLNGVAWWVNRRLVGEPSWDLGMGPVIDSRRAAAKRYTYIVEADPLHAAVKPDWSGYYGTAEVVAAHRAVDDFVRQDLNSLLGDSRRDRKRLALVQNRAFIEQLNPTAQDQIARFLEDIQTRCPSIGDRELSDVVEVLAKLEKSRSGYALIEKLAKSTAEDMDSLNHIFSEWSIEDAKTALNELRYRLALVERLEGLVEDKRTDELHELQPLFERGLWIFGPELEGPQFVSNRTLATTIRTFLGGGEPAHPRRRADFILLPHASLGVYARDRFDERHEVDGLAHVVVVELKRGGFEIGRKETRQAQDYCSEIRKSGRVTRATKITAYVLGSSVATDAEEPVQEGQTMVYPRTYDVVLRGAHARTFHLLRQLPSCCEVKMKTIAGKSSVFRITSLMLLGTLCSVACSNSEARRDPDRIAVGGAAGSATGGASSAAGGAAAMGGVAGASPALDPQECPKNLPGPRMVRVSRDDKRGACIDVHEVTQGQYHAYAVAVGVEGFKKAGFCKSETGYSIYERGPESVDGWGDTQPNGSCPKGPYDPAKTPDAPVGCLAACHAAAYCAWAGKELCGGFDGPETLDEVQILDPQVSIWANACRNGGASDASQGSKELDACGPARGIREGQTEPVASYPECHGQGAYSELLNLSGGAVEWVNARRTAPGAPSPPYIQMGPPWWRQEAAACGTSDVTQDAWANGFRCCARLPKLASPGES